MIFVILVLVMGPKKMVLYARKAGKWLRILKTYLSSLMGEFQETVMDPLDELKDPLKEVTQPLEELKDAIQAPVREFSDAVLELEKEEPDAKNSRPPEEPLEFAEPEPVLEHTTPNTVRESE